MTVLTWQHECCQSVTLNSLCTTKHPRLIKVIFIWFCTQWESDKHIARLPGRFCPGLTQHYVTPLVLEPFCMATPQQAPCGCSVRKGCRRWRLPHIGWQDAGSISHKVDPLSSCSLLSPAYCWPVISCKIRPLWGFFFPNFFFFVKASALFYLFSCTNRKRHNKCWRMTHDSQRQLK